MGALSKLAPTDTSAYGVAVFTLTAFPAAILVYFFLKSIYRLYFHPLSKYPGPFLAKITNAHQTLHAYRGDRHLELFRQHEKYGKSHCTLYLS